MDERNDDLFDDLFEPFELDEGPPPPTDEPEPEPEPPPPEPAAEISMVTCPSCGTANPDNNRHCEACGARLSSEPLPVAPLPAIRSSAGTRALVVLAAVVLVIALGVLVINLRGGDEPDTSSTSSTTTLAPAPDFVELFPVSVRASSSLGDSWAAENLLDNDTNTEWQDASQRGSGAEIEFSFAEPVRIESVEIVNIPEADRFRLNYRVRGYEIQVDDLGIDISSELEDSNERQRIPIGTVGTTTLTFQVKTTYPAESVGDQTPFLELAIADIRFFGALVTSS